MGLRDVLLDELKDLYSAEKQLVKALPKMAKGAEDEELSASITEHLEQTRGQVERLEQAFEALGEKPKAKTCKAMQGLVEEGAEALEEDEEGAAHDILIVGAALRVEHYEQAAYTLVVEMAKALGETKVEKLLQATLDEELETAEKLLEKGKELMTTAVSEEEGEDEEEGEEDADAESEPEEEDDEVVSISGRRKPVKTPPVPPRKNGTR